ncbi:disks large-associated protein 5-like [Macrobrachium nipponense]|uniref:disks large-associated protein 5-like n=1 Tax=Macrobrachium nipponense TaxID=159736 RepID=UPI0030C7C4CC
MKKALKSSSEEQKSRDEARKKLLEERCKAMKAAMKAKQGQPDANGSTDGVEILVAEEKITYLQENLTGEKEDEWTKSNEGGPANEKVKKMEKQKEGHHFLQLVDKEVSELQGLTYNAESDLETFKPEMSEEVQGKVLAATGKARLLIAQKVEQFRGLCQQNIDGPKGEEPTIMAADLEGFWDMVSIQVDNVHHLFKEVSVLKTNGWKEDLITQTSNNVTKGPMKKKPVKVMKKAMKSSTEEQKSRDEARKKLLEERRKAMKEAMKAKQGQPDANGSIDGVEILVAEEKITQMQKNSPGEKEDESTKSDEGGPVNEKVKEMEKQKEGHHFLQLVDKEVSELQGIIYKAESDLETFKPEMSEEVQGKVLAATGKARLLISQKVEQFRGLCQQNIDGPKGDEPAIIAEDLAGFWDMVSIQVDEVHGLFKEIGDLKTNGWKQDENTQITNNVTKGPAKRKPAKVMNKTMKSSTEEQKSRDKARKKLLEERRKAMKAAMKAKQGQPDANGSTDGVEILVAEEKISQVQKNSPGEKEDKSTKSDEGGPVNEKVKEMEKQKEGHHFLQLVDKEVSELQGIIYKAESDLETFKPEMSEEVQGKVLAATGKARLLI